MKRLSDRTRGQSLVEFALVLPFFVLLLFGIIDMGRYVYTSNALASGAREAARAGSVGSRPSPDCDALTREQCIVAIADNRSWGVPGAVISTTADCTRIGPSSTSTVAANSCRTNDLLNVRTETTFTLVTPLVAQFLGSFTIVGDSSVAVNQ